MKVDIYIPTFKRANKIKGLVSNIVAKTEGCRIIFIVERDDMDSYFEAIRSGAVAIINHRTPNYAGAINSAWECFQSEVFFVGADDLLFYDNWLEEAKNKLSDDIFVVGTNDLHNQEVKRGEHATHYLVSGEYIKEVGGVIDGTAPVLFEGYSHNWVDREFVGVARSRGVFSPCIESVVEHLHFTFGLSPMDETYKKTRERVGSDEATYQKRRSMWNWL